MNNLRNRWISLGIVAGLAISASSAALAHVDVGVNIGVPGFAYAPEPVYAPPPPPVYAPAPPVVVVSPGWYGERYYDGHRYWERREWEERRHEWRDARGHDNGWHGHDNGWHGHDDGWHGHDDDRRHGDH